MEKQTIEIDILPPGLNGDQGLIRLSKYGYKKVRGQFMWLVKAANPKKMEGQVRITFERHETNPMDWDNHCASFKIIGDCLERLNVIDDDSPDTIVEFIPKKKRVHSYAERKIVITIEAA